MAYKINKYTIDKREIKNILDTILELTNTDEYMNSKKFIRTRERYNFMDIDLCKFICDKVNVQSAPNFESIFNFDDKFEKYFKESEQNKLSHIILKIMEYLVREKYNPEFEEKSDILYFLLILRRKRKRERDDKYI